MTEIRFVGEPPDNFLSLLVLGRSHPNSTDYWDGNWLTAGLTVKVGSFEGKVSGHIRAEELVSFNRDLQTLFQKLTGEAAFKTMEDWLMIRVECNKLGHIKITGFVLDDHIDGNTLNFTLSTDQTFLPAPMRQIEQVLGQFPVIGHP
jgi:hypothetical protein